MMDQIIVIAGTAFIWLLLPAALNWIISRGKRK